MINIGFYLTFVRNLLFFDLQTVAIYDFLLKRKTFSNIQY